MIRKASCDCGQLTLQCQGDPIRVSVCHCLACQRRTGSIFGVQARYSTSKVSVEGESRRYTRACENGNWVNMEFCPVCASTVYWDIPDSPEFIAVAVGAFADPAFPPSIFSGHETPASNQMGLSQKHWD